MSEQFRQDEIEELAGFIAFEAGDGLPTDVLRIASSEDISVSFNDYGPHFDGMLEWSGNDFHIYCNLALSRDANSGRARFTIAHELGHYFIDSHREGLKRGFLPRHGSLNDFASRNEIEQQADSFAACLLMPRGRFDSRARSRPFSVATAKQLANEFQTSLASTAIRYVQLSERACAVVRWANDKVVWMCASQSMRDGGAVWANVTHATLPRDSATAIALTRDNGDVLSRGTVATAWFSRRGPLVWRDAILIEEAMSLGRFGALTLLYVDE